MPHPHQDRNEPTLRDRFVLDPLGNPVPVPQGMDPKDVVDQITRRYNRDPQLLGEVQRRLQMRDVEGTEGDPMNPEFRRAFLAGQVDGPVVPGDIDDMLVRADLARSDLATEKLAKLESHFPDSQFSLAQDVNGEPVILYRHPGEAQYREVESPEFSTGDLAALAGGILSEDVIAEVMAFMTSRGGTSIVRRMLKGGAAAAGGEAIKAGVEDLRGFEQSTAGPLTERILFTGGAAALGVGIFDPIARVTNMVRGVRGLAAPTQEASRVMRAANDEGLPPLLPGQIHPVFESLQQQSAGTSQVMKQAQQDRFAAVVEKLSSFRDELGDVRNLPDDVLERVVNKEEARILSAINSDPRITFSTAGQSVKKGLQDFNEMLAEREGRAYREAFKASDKVRYDLSRAQQMGAAIRNRIVGDFRLRELDTTVNLPLIPVRNPEFKSALKELVNYNPDVRISPGGASPLEQVIRLRSRFFNMKDDPRLSGSEREGARIIHGVLTEIMRNPRTIRGPKGQIKPSVMRKWRRAASLTTSRERFIGKTYSRFMATSDTPAKIAERLSPTNPDVVKNVRRMLEVSGQRNKWSLVQNAYKNKLLLNPARIRPTIARAPDRDALHALIDRNEIEPLLRISDEWARLESSPIKKMLRKGADVATRAISLVENGTAQQIRGLIDDIGGKDTPSGRALQASVIEALLNRSTRKVEGKTLLDKDRFLAGMAQFRKRAVLEEIFDKSTLNRLERNFEDYVSFLPKSMGAGEGIQKAEAASAAGGVFFPTPTNIVRAAKGGAMLARNRIIAWMFTSPRASKFLIGRGKKDLTKVSSADYLRGVGGSLAVIADNMAEIAESGGFDISDEDIVPDAF